MIFFMVFTVKKTYVDLYRLAISLLYETYITDYITFVCKSDQNMIRYKQNTKMLNLHKAHILTGPSLIQHFLICTNHIS